MSDFERIAPAEGDRIKTSMRYATKANPLRDALVGGEVIFVEGVHMLSGLVQGNREWARKLNKRLVCRTGERRERPGIFMWLDDKR